jgi:prepilin-type N-terminal cleavage/methylation domain-containing protein
MRRAGFTIAEVLIVLIIMALITAMALPKLATSAQKTNVRSSRVELSTMVAKARAAAVQRGCVDTLHITTGSAATAWVTVCKASMSGTLTLDTIGGVDLVGKRMGVSLSTSTTNYIFDPRGLLVGGAGGTIVISGRGFTDSVVINAIGKVTH